LTTPTINPLSCTPTQAAQLVGLINNMQQPPSYIYVLKADLPEIIPETLKEKCVSGLLMVSTGPNATTYAMLNLYRKDYDEIDQHPLCFVVSANGVLDRPFLIGHADHAGRTQDIPLGFLDSYSSTMHLVAGCLSTPPGELSSTGPLSNLLGTSNANAFLAGMVKMDEQISTAKLGWPSKLMPELGHYPNPG
jgi:hypothetical protein